MSIASLQLVSATPSSSRHKGAIRLAPIANSTPVNRAARANDPAK